MNLLPRLALGCWSLLTVLLLVSCAQGEVVQNPVITFDGENCEYEGPEVVREGNLVFVFNNLSEDPGAHMHVNVLTEDATWEDILQLAAEGPIVSVPGMGRELIAVSYEGDTEEYPLKPGSYAIFCVVHAVGGWPASSLQVE